MKKRIFTLALVVLFALTFIPLFAVADSNLIELTSEPIGIDADDSHWGWSSRVGIDTLPQNMRGIDGIRIEFDIEEGNASFVVQSPFDWWDQVEDGFPFTDNVLEIIFEEHFEEWESHNKQYEVHLVFGNWDETILPENIVGAWLIGEDWGAPQFEPDDEDPVLAAPTVDDFGGHDHWGWSMENGSLPWNMSEITAIVIEFDVDDGEVDLVIQSPHSWWDQIDGGVPIVDGVMHFEFTDLAEWADHVEQNEMHIVIGNWSDLSPENVVSAQLIGTVAEGIPNPEAGEVVEMPPEGTLPFNMGLGGSIWGDEFAQIGWNGDTRAIDGGYPFAGEGGLTAGLLAEAAWFVIYVDNSPDDYEAEMLQLTIFGNANGWSWEGGTMEAPTVQIYDTFVPGAIAFPLGGHPYIEAIRQAGEEELENRNFGLSFQYGSGEDNLGGIENLGITGVWLYAELPEGAEAEPEPEPDEAVEEEPAEEPDEAVEEEPEPEPASDGGFPWWGIVLIVAGVGAVVAVILVVVKKKKA